MIDYELIGRRIKAARNKNNMTQEQLANTLNISEEYLSRIESGRAKPSLTYLDKICTTLNVDLGKILGGSSVSRTRLENEKVTSLYEKCPDDIKPLAMKVLEDFSKHK